MGISILIVDDDRYLVEKLEETVQWEKTGISMVFTAYNIRQAQKLITEFPIQLLLCDIDMPQGSGLELLEWVRSQKLELECIFLSSYANFAYAQKALSLSTREYLLKPISSQELEAAITKVVNEYLRKDACIAAEAEEGDGFWAEFFETVTGHRELLKRAIAEGRYRRDDELYLEMIRVYLNPRETEYRKKLSLLDHRIRGLAHEFSETEGLETEEIVRVRESGWMLVVKKTEKTGDFCEMSVRWKHFLTSAIGQRVCVYIGQPRPVLETERSWEALEELEKHYLPGEDDILAECGPDDASGEAAQYEPLPWEIWQKSTDLAEELSSICESICGRLRQMYDARLLTYERLEWFLKEQEHFLYGYLEKKQLQFSELFDSGEYIQKEKEAHISLGGTLEFVCWLYDRLQGNSLNATKQRDVVGQVKDYIERNLGNELSRSRIAKEVWLSEDYVSKLFKSTTGMSLPTYIAARRMERAKEYLVHSGLPVSRIAMEVGYGNFSYFSKTFRDATGMTPNEYRSQWENNKKTNT